MLAPGGELYVALAGSHQIAMIDLREGTIELVAGDGREALVDGPGLSAALAQPSGLSLQGDVLYIADSESSGVRALDLRSRRLYTLAGGPGLFDFGDELGPIRPERLRACRQCGDPLALDALVRTHLVHCSRPRDDHVTGAKALFSAVLLTNEARSP